MIRTFPYLEIKGTHYEVGRAIGEMFRGKIQETIQDRQKNIPRYQLYLKRCNAYVKATESAYPHLLDEMNGIADGAKVGHMDLFFHNCPEVYDKELLDEWDREQAETEDHCTIGVSFNQNGALIGHNEDWGIESLDELYILKATIGDTTFLGLHYATSLPGTSASMNNWGLVQCINELYQETSVGVPKSFVSRAILGCKTLDEALSVIVNTTRASGYNHLLVQGDDVWDIEIARPDIDIQKMARKAYVHTNHCISKHMQQYQILATKSSKARFTRATALIRNDMTFEDMKTLLSDTNNEAYPICREDVTIGSVIIEPKDKTMHICYGMPSVGTYIPYTL
jgi:hypothetical protein